MKSLRIDDLGIEIVTRNLPNTKQECQLPDRDLWFYHKFCMVEENGTSKLFNSVAVGNIVQ
jgi:hypothetical protein